MKNIIKFILIPFLIFFFIFFFIYIFFVKFTPPEGFTKDHHTFKEISEFAMTLDPNAKVSENYHDTLEKQGTIEYYYREWPAVINGIECHVSSVTDFVWNTTKLGIYLIVTFQSKLTLKNK